RRLRAMLAGTVVAHRSADPPHLHSFPTRRSSDLCIKLRGIFFMNKYFNNVLLVDDDAVSNFINEMTLHEMKISNFIHVSENGKEDRKSTRLNSSHVKNSYAVCCLHKNTTHRHNAP